MCLCARGCSKAAFGEQADDGTKNHPAGSLAAGTLAPSLLSLSAALDAFEQHMVDMEQGESLPLLEQAEAEAARTNGGTNGGISGAISGGISGGISGSAMPAAARLPAAVIGAACAQWAEAHGQQLVQSEAQLEEAMREFVEQVGGE